MANLITSKQDHTERTNEWKARIDDMEYFIVKGDFLSLNRRQNKNVDVNTLRFSSSLGWYNSHNHYLLTQKEWLMNYSIT